ncbi:hypothetical protein OSB04_031622 [Centaurea solstitialis]|uniref:Reverse transcriptase Ty1/copia-type domain-containing protein n=1 Tax=Centaurea solstitialis TaxID=347529 RepID=A0AA38S9B8_9ASTR|nr:hypothetical protein OSB04_031622 [Centaurea solstitialis]
MVNCMLNQSGLATTLWGEALLTVCHIHNRITSRVIPTSPYELWKGRKPNLDYFKVWGCIAYYRTPDPKRSKLGPHFFENNFSEDAENSDRTLDTSLPGTSRENSKTPQWVDEPRRSTRVRKEKSLGDDFYSFLVEGSHKKVTREVILSMNIDDEPKTFKEAMSKRDASLWKEAINDEMDSIMGNGTWVLVDLPKGIRPIGSNGSLKESAIQMTKNYLSLNFKMKDLGEVDTILGIKVRRSESKISLGQSHYIENILIKFQHLNIKEFNTPFDSCVKLEKYSSRALAQLEYASAIGCLMYAMHCTRPDIAFVVSRLSQYTRNPGSDHWKAIRRVLGYLIRTSDLELTYKTHPGILKGYSDASWVDN